MNSHHLLLQQLDKQEQKEFEILAHYLIPLGWKDNLSHADFAKLLSSYNFLEIDNNYAERRLKKFQKFDLIEIKKNSTSPTNGERGKRLANTIILKSFAYQGTLPTGIVPLDSILYIKRDADEKCLRELSLARDVSQSVPFIRVKAAKGMGKSSLLDRISHFLEKEKKGIVARIDLATDAFGDNTLNDSEKLFRRFTEEVATAFSKLIPGFQGVDLETVWNKHKTSGKNCTDYLEEYIFKKIAEVPKFSETGKTLLIDGIDSILGKQTQTDFLLVLRTWNEEKMKLVDSRKVIWPSMVIAYSTEPYPDANFKGSPLQNVGTPVELLEFTPECVLSLAKIYGLSWDENNVNGLMKLIGGHPSLVQRALYKISQTNISLEGLEAEASKISGAFSNYLLHHLERLQARQNKQLLACFQKIMRGEKCKDAFAKFQLEQIGLIKSSGNKEEVSCELYRMFFEENLDL
ncbi:MAG: hypothetical protein F6K40_00690 [Okeania sp. SIO3I5]|uniref:AAA-like domain-containing protein n=1 Tax=Okeania sp. SIO3I5 TaxID=2607805 RepID=UPI0013B5CF08|nr:AAA-like domain-containing protein [Okeania sp. SIO3I5]NEQ34904.1 hypothetical protein [Okeania sp. SIO3I5]